MEDWKDWKRTIETFFKNWNPFPDWAYCEKHGIPMTEDGRIILDTHAGRHIEYRP